MVEVVDEDCASKCDNILRTPATVGAALKPAAPDKTKGSNTKSNIKKQQDQCGVGEPCEAPIANLPEPPSSLRGPEGLVW